MRAFFHETEAREGKLFPLDAPMPEDWHDTPAAFGVITAPSQEQLAAMANPKAEVPAVADMTKDELLALAEQRGIDVDKRLGVEKLRAVLNGDGT